MTTTADAGTPTTASFREQGFAHVPRLLTPDEVNRYRAATHDALSAQSTADDTFNTGIVSTIDGWERNATLRELAVGPRVGAVAEHLVGLPLRVWGGEVLAKAPHTAARTGLHDDLTFELLDSAIAVNVWIALVDVPVERGCLTFLPESHHRGGPHRGDLDEQHSDPDGYLLNRWPELRWTPQVTVPLRAGDATVHQHRTAHSAGANTTDEERLSFVVTLVDADATYRPLPGADPLDLQSGQKLPDARYPRVTTAHQ